MSNNLNGILEDFDSLSLGEQEIVLDIETKRLIEKRERLIKEAKEAEAECKTEKLKPESVH